MRINMVEVLEAKTVLESSRKKIESELDDVKYYLRETADSVALSGKVKTAIKNKIVNYQIPLLTEYTNAAFYISQEFASQLEAFRSIVRENSMDAIIDTDELTRLESKFAGVSRDYAEIDTRTKQIYASIADLVSVTSVSNAGFAEQLAKTKRVLTNTKTWMGDFNARKNTSQVSEILSQQQSQLAQLNAVGKIGYTDSAATGLYKNTDFKKRVAKELVTEQAALTKYNKSYAVENYIWQQYPMRLVGKVVSGLVNLPNEERDFLEKHHLDGITDRGKNALTLIRQVAEFDKKLGGKPGKGGSYGQQGVQAINYLQKDWRDIKKFLRKSNHRNMAQKMQGSFRHNLNRLNHKLHFNEESKFGKIVKKADTITSYVKNPLKKVVKDSYKISSKFKNIKPLGKITARIGWVGMAADAGFSGYQAYDNKDSQTYKNPGKSVIHAGVDQLKNAGPIEGAVVGSTMGPVFAALGLLFGTANMAFGIVSPRRKDKFYNFMENGLDKGWDKVSSFGKSFSKNWTSFKGSNKLRSISYE